MTRVEAISINTPDLESAIQDECDRYLSAGYRLTGSSVIESQLILIFQPDPILVAAPVQPEPEDE